MTHKVRVTIEVDSADSTEEAATLALEQLRDDDFQMDVLDRDDMLIDTHTAFELE